jgi:hypothetical protein
MKRLFLIVLVAGAVISPTALAADPNPAQVCKGELARLGAANFKSLYAPGGSGANAMGKCVSKHAKAASVHHTNAAKACKAEQALPEADFRAAHGGKSFAEFYGKNKNHKNAYGKCVSAKAQAAHAEQQAATMNAAKACKAERKANSAAFTAKYGGKPARAFGKCVSKHAKKQ